MGSGKILRVGGVESLDSLVCAMCADYERRQTAIDERSATRRTDMEYRYLNFHILDAASEIAGERYGIIYVNEIGRRIGYASSLVDHLSEGAYKLEKQRIKENIARKLHLLDI
ncbi:MAG: hypothetical protein IJX38_06430 [Clostridia bacterium]|nr:hypothetical protein [Clostridia bacterium]